MPTLRPERPTFRLEKTTFRPKKPIFWLQRYLFSSILSESAAGSSAKPYPTDHRHIKGIPHECQAILGQMLQSSFLHEKIVQPSPPPLPPRPPPFPFIILLTCSLRLKSQKGFIYSQYIYSIVSFKSSVMQPSFMKVDELQTSDFFYEGECEDQKMMITQRSLKHE